MYDLNNTITKVLAYHGELNNDTMFTLNIDLTNVGYHGGIDQVVFDVVQQLYTAYHTVRGQRSFAIGNTVFIVHKDGRIVEDTVESHDDSYATTRKDMSFSVITREPRIYKGTYTRDSWNSDDEEVEYEYTRFAAVCQSHKEAVEYVREHNLDGCDKIRERLAKLDGDTLKKVEAFLDKTAGDKHE